MKSANRSLFLDQWRSIAIFMMIFFHFCFDLALFNFISIDVQNDFLWWIQPRIIVSMFMCAVGASLFLTHQNGIRYKKFILRFVKLALAAAIISLVTFLFFPSQWIYFGTLHSIAVCSLMALPFIKWPNLALVFGLIIVSTLFIPAWQWPWFQLPHPSMDYIPPFPWLGFCLIGIFLAKQGFFNLNPTSALPLKLQQYLAWPGTHSLKIYLIHQPVLYGSVALFWWLLQL